jgi:hypothetical protein
MVYKTFAQIKAKVERELDLEVEEFVQPLEFIEYVNDGISMAEADIHKLGLEDEYFLTKEFFPLTMGVEDYVLPTKLYMNKIRGIQYSFGSTIYTIQRLRDSDTRFEDIDRINQYLSVTDYYKYTLRNDSAAAGVMLQLVPKSRETSTTNVKIWYIREAAKWDEADTVGVGLCDLPQIAIQFLYQYVKYRCYEKEGHTNTDAAKADLAAIHATMMATMEQMVPDNNTEIVRDLSLYNDFS